MFGLTVLLRLFTMFCPSVRPAAQCVSQTKCKQKNMDRNNQTSKSLIYNKKSKKTLTQCTILLNRKRIRYIIEYLLLYRGKQTVITRKKISFASLVNKKWLISILFVTSGYALRGFQGNLKWGRGEGGETPYFKLQF